MSNEDDAFRRAIRAAPDDDLPRLVYADWLDERGDPRGEFIRAQINLRNGEGKKITLQRRCKELLAKFGAQWATEDAKELLHINPNFPAELIAKIPFDRGFGALFTASSRLLLNLNEMHTEMAENRNCRGTENVTLSELAQRTFWYLGFIDDVPDRCPYFNRAMPYILPNDIKSLVHLGMNPKKRIIFRENVEGDTACVVASPLAVITRHCHKYRMEAIQTLIALGANWYDAMYRNDVPQENAERIARYDNGPINGSGQHQHIMEFYENVENRLASRYPGEPPPQEAIELSDRLLAEVQKELEFWEERMLARVEHNLQPGNRWNR